MPVQVDDERSAGRMKEFDDIRKMLNTPSWQCTSAPKIHQQLARYLNTLRDYEPRLFEEFEMEQLCTMVLQVIKFFSYVYDNVSIFRTCISALNSFYNLIVKVSLL